MNSGVLLNKLTSRIVGGRIGIRSGRRMGGRKNRVLVHRRCASGLVAATARMYYDLTRRRVDGSVVFDG